MNTTSDQWPYLPKNIIHLFIILILKHVRFRNTSEIPQPCNQLSFMLHELVFIRCYSQFASYPYTFASYSYSCKILRLIHMCPATKSGRSESVPFVKATFHLTISMRA